VAAPDYADLLACSRFPGDIRTLAIAGCLAEAIANGDQPLVRGLSEQRFNQLLRSCFAGVELKNGGTGGTGQPEADEFDDLLALLLESRAEPTELNAWISHCIASASLRQRHLWQDMGLPNRDTLSGLLAMVFPQLAARNVGDMKWKKFFYRQLCQQAGIPLCRSPNCRDCRDFPVCFGPEVPLGPDGRAAEGAVLR
jgi:nitrogen fixation protein NifQ